MLKTTALAVVALFTMACAAQADTGNELKSYCTGRSGFDSGRCHGYISGVVEWQLIIAAAQRMAPIKYCLPEGVTYGQIVDIVKKFMADNPDKTHWEASVIIHNAVLNAFPCATPKAE
jgi:hypothetical protein